MAYEWKKDLIVLESRPGSWASGVDALLLNPNSAHTPFIVARGFDEESMSWASGKYLEDLMDALVELRGCIHPDHAISGCSSHDVSELYGREWGISRSEASDIAREVNAEVGGDDSLYADELYSAVVRHCGSSPAFARACAEASDRLSSMAVECAGDESRALASSAADFAIRYRADHDAMEEVMALCRGDDQIVTAIMNYAIIHATVRHEAGRPFCQLDPSSRAAQAKRAALRGTASGGSVSPRGIGV